MTIEIDGEVYANRGFSPFRGTDLGNDQFGIKPVPVPASGIGIEILTTICNTCPLGPVQAKYVYEHGVLQAALAKCTGWIGNDGRLQEATLILSQQAGNASLDFTGRQIERATLCKFNPATDISPEPASGS